MAPPRKRREEKGVAKLFSAGISLLALGVALHVAASTLTPSGNAMLGPMSRALRDAAPYPFFFGLALLFVSWLLRPRSDAASMPPKLRPRFVERESQDSVTAFQPRTVEPTPVAVQHVARKRASQWSAKVFDDIEWRRFEAVCASLFAHAGFETRAQSHGADGGVDIWLYSKHAEGPAALVQCKHWLGKPVGVKELREFFGVMASHKMRRGTFATTSTFTQEALKFAKENGISALDGKALLALVARRTPEQQQALLDIAYEGEYWRPTCASCGLKMVERVAKSKGSAFWGCSNYPLCRSTLPMRAT